MMQSRSWMARLALVAAFCGALGLSLLFLAAPAAAAPTDAEVQTLRSQLLNTLQDRVNRLQ